MSGHTPGEWEVHDRGHGYSVQAPNGQSVAWVSTSTMSGTGGTRSVLLPEARANARMVAAAPKMLDALQAVAYWLESFSVPPTATITEKEDALALIRAATAIATEGGAS